MVGTLDMKSGGEALLGSRREDSSLFAKLLGVAFFGVWMLVVVDGIWTYAMIKLAGSRVIPVTVLMWGVMALGVARAAVRNEVAVDLGRFGTVLLWLFLCYLIGVSMYHANLGDVSIFGIWFSFFLYYFYLFASPLMASFRGGVNERMVSVLIVVSGLALALLGTAQHALNDLFEVGRTVSAASGAFNLGFGGNTRANGLFAHSEDLGFFLSLAAAIVAAWAARCRRFEIVIPILVWLVLAVGCYSTLTRSGYICFVSVTAFAYIFSGNEQIRCARFWRYAPIVLMCAGLGLFFARAVVEAVFGGASVVFSSSSLDDRLYGVSYYAKALSNEGWLAWLFGLGWRFNGAARAYVPVDNQFIAIIVNVGLIGICLWFALTWLFWESVLKRAQEIGSYLHIAVAAMYGTWLLLGVFGYIQIYQLVLVLGAAIGTGNLSARKDA